MAAYIFTTNVQRSWRVSEALEYGIVGVNEGLVSTEVGISRIAAKLYGETGYDSFVTASFPL